MASPFQSYLTLSKWIFVEEKVAVVWHSKMKREREKERESYRSGAKYKKQS